MRAIKFTTRIFAIIAILAIAFGPYSGLSIFPAYAQSTTPIFVPGAEGQPTGVVKTTSNGGVIDPLSGKKVDPGSTASACNGITSCMAYMIYAVGPGFASWVASWSAYFFDFIVRLSLLSPTYTLSFLTQGWTLVLSLANMFFIFILVYAAFVIMLRAETARTLQTLAWVIAIALVVNFSFFFTRVVIDAGNIIGVQFYNAVAFTPQGTPIGVIEGTQSTTQTPDITKPLMAAIGVEQLLGTQSFDSITSALGGSSSVFSSASWSALITLSVVFIFAAVMFWILAIALLMVGLKFFLRVIGLWLIIVASPLAFVAQTLGNTRHFFETWLRTLVGYSMYPAVFLFMFWVLNQFATQLGGGLKLLDISSNSAVVDASHASATTLLILIVNVSIRMMFIIVLLYVMLKVSDWVIEQAGGMASTFINRGSAAILGGGFRGAAWAGALAGRNSAGRLANRLANNPQLATSAKTNPFSRALWRGSNGLSRSTYDMRNAPAGSTVRRGVESITGSLNIGKPSNKNIAANQERIEKLDKRMKKIAEKAKSEEEKSVDKKEAGDKVVISEKSTTADGRKGSIITPSDVPERKLSDADRASRLSTPPRPPSPAAPAASASRPTESSIVSTMPYATQRLFAQQKEEEKRRTAAANVTMDHLLGAKPAMRAIPNMTAPKTDSAPASSTAVPAASVIQTVAAVQGKAPMPERIEVSVPANVSNTSHTERVIERQVTRDTIRESAGPWRELIKGMRKTQDVTMDVGHKMLDTMHAQAHLMKDQAGELKQDIERSDKHITNALAKKQALEPLNPKDVPPEFREAAE